MLLTYLIRPLVKKIKGPKGTIFFDKISLIVIGLTLLGYASFLTLIIFLSVTFTAYGGLIILNKHLWISRRPAMWVLVILMLSPLIYYKYGYFFGTVFLNREFDVMKDIVIPVGISFYTFQKIGFVIDTLLHKEKIPPLLDYMNFAGFFPQIVAGPIERRSSLLPQVKKFSFALKWENLDTGVRYIILGLFFKLCLADSIACHLNRNTADNVWQIWQNNIVFGFRIYFDFAGYGMAALGLGKCLGIDLIMNFKSPYTAGSFSEFWRRWHVSLTNWFRDYIYFNLGGSRTKFWALNIMIVFLVSGLWHGAAWNFIIWGGLCGAGLIINRVFNKTGIVLWSPIGWILTMGSCFYIWMFFYETRLDFLYQNSLLLFNPMNYRLGSLSEHITIMNTDIISFIGTMSLILLTIGLEYWSRLKTGEPYCYLTKTTPCCIMVFMMVLFGQSVTNEFIYFAF